MKKLAVIFSIILSLLIVRGVFAENIIQDNFIINRITKLIRLSTYFNQFLIGDTTTSTDYILEVHDDIWADDSMRANQFCINTTTPDCITAWPSGATAAYPINQWLDTTNTPTFVGLNASSTNVDSLVIYNGITLGGVYRNTWPAASGGSAGSWWATSSNNLIGYPDLAGDYSIVIGAAATTSEVKFEVNGSAKIGTNLIVGTELLAPAARLTVLNSTTTNIDNLTVYSSVSLPNNSVTDAMVADTITASNYLSLVNWFSTTTHANISSLPSLSITESQISDLTHYTDADTGDYLDASTTIQTYFSNAATAYSWGDHATAGYFLLSDWFSTTTHANISSLPSLSITESQISDLSHYTDADTGDYLDASTTIQTYFSNAATAFSWGDHAVAGYFSLTDWFSTTTHANISSLPSLSITESQISDLSHYTDADTGDYIDASTTIQTFFYNASDAYSWGDHALAGYITGNLFDQWLDTTNTPTFLGLNASSTNVDNLIVYNQVGVNTTSPAYALDVWGNARLATSTANVYLDFFGQYYTASQNQSTNTATTSAATGASATWFNPTNITASDNSYASKTIYEYGSSGALNATNFGFAIPTGATINGIVLGVEGNISSGSFVWTSVRLLKNGSAVGDNKTSMSMFTGIDKTLSTGGDSDLWGTTWTAEDINNTNFGATITLEDEDDTTGTVYVDHITIKVYYSYSVVGKSTFASSIGIDKDNELFKISTSTGLTGKSIFSYNVAGNVGIGIDNASSTFEVAGSGRFWQDLRVGGELINASITRLAVLNASTTNADLLTAYTSLAVATTTPWSGYELAVAGDGVFTGNLYVMGNATSSHFAADEICLNGTCRTTWPTDAGAVTFWEYAWDKTITTTSTDIGLFVTASSTVAADFRVDGDLTTTGKIYAGSNLYLGHSSNKDNDYLYFDAGVEYLVWNNTRDWFVLSNDLSVTGYATTTAGLFTQGNLRVGGNATTTGSHEFTTDDGLHGLRIIPGSTTTTLDFF